ncbi:WD40-repeat-containing domain [Pseudocohnilembus persalinus]|uniref:HECT-type E3 ubiquitin transferase n=1 Tax=Pseudocohnilembus persalinus TaxID=266149 RepID=A0A0V0R7X6_PSEPJ|nr:WD40-repeat-containing domain [Pseudocohnilembus persalinus]|eukprot:KRX10426.1 WD40-repeat-containing domain [Pseudocohnilembus persalinus]
MLLESGIIPIFYNIDFHLFRLYESDIFGTIYNLENLNEEWNNWYGYWGKLFDEELVLKKLFEKQEENSLENNVQDNHIIYFEKIMHYILMFIEINKPDEFLFPLRANYGKDLWNILERINSHVFETEKQIQSLMRFYKNYYFTVISEEKEANRNQLRFQSYKSQDFIKNNQNCQECKVGNITIQQDSEFNCKLCNTLYDEGKYYFQCENKCKDSQIICFNCSEVPCCEKCDELLEIKMNPLNNNENKFTCFDCQNEYEQLPSFYCPKDQRNKCVFCWQLRYLDKNQGIEITCPAQNCKEITKLEFYIPKDKEWCCGQCKQIAKKIKVARCEKCGSDICIDCVRPKLKYTDDTNYPILTKEFFQSKINFSGTSLPSLENLEVNEQKQKNSEIIQSQKQQKIYNQFFVQENIKTLKESENFGEDYLKQKVKEVVNNQLRNELFQKVGRKKYPNFMFEFELLLEMQSLEDLLLFSTPTMCLNNLEPNYGLQQAYEILQYYKKNYPINMEYPFICENLELLKSLDSYKTKEERKAFLMTLNDKPQQLQQILDYQKFLQVLYLINFLVSFLPNQETSQIDKEMKTSFLEFYDFFNQQAYNFLVYLFTRVSKTNNKLQDLSENDIQINLDKFKIKFQVSDAYNLFELIIEKFQKFIEVYNKQKTGSVVGQIENSEHYSNILQLIRDLPVNEEDNKQVSNYQLISFLMFQEKFRVVNFKKYKLYNFGGNTLNTDLLEKINYYLVQLKQKAIEYQSFKVIIEYFYHYSCGYLGQIYSCNLVEKNSKFKNEKDQQFFDELIKFEQKQLGKKQIELQNQEDYNEDGRGKGKYLQILSKEGNLKLQQYIRPYIFKIFLSTLNLFIFNDNNYDRQNFEKLLQQSGEEIFQIILQAQGKKDLEFKTVKQIIDSEYHSLNCDSDRNSSQGNPVCISKEDSDDNREQKSQIPDKNILYITIGYTEITFGSSDYKGLEVVTINETEVIDNQTVQKLEYEVRKIISEKIRNELQMEQVQIIHKEESSLGDMQKDLFQFYQQLQDKGLLQINEKHEHKQKQKEEIQELIDKINYPNQGQEKINKTQKQQPSVENEKINGEEKEDENQKQERIENFELDAMKDNLKFLQDLEQLKSNVNISVPFLFNQLTNIKKEQQYLKQIELEASNKQIQEDNIIFQQYNVNDKDKVLQGELITAQSEDKLYLALGSKKGHFVYILDKLGNIIKECNLELVYKIKEKKQQLNQIFHIEFDKDCENLAIITVLFMGTNNGIQVFFDKNTQQQSRLKELTKAIEYCDWNLEGQVFMIGMQEKRFCYTNYKAEKIWISNKTRDFNTIQYGGKKDGEITYFGTIITSDNQLKFLHFKGNSYKQDLLSSVEFQPKFGTIRMYQILPNSLVLTSLSKGYITAHDVEKKPKLLKSLQVFKGNIDYFCVDKSYSKVAVCSGNVIKIVDLDKFQELQTVYIKGESEANLNKNVKTLYAAWGQDSNIIYHSTNEEFSVIIPKYEQQFMPEKCKNYLLKWLFQQYKNNLEFLLEILEKEEIKQILNNLFQDQYKYFIEDFKQDKGNFYKKIIQQDLLNVLDQSENKLIDVELYENKEYWQNKKNKYPASQIVGSYLIYEQLLHKYYFNTPFYNISNKEQLDFNIYIQTLLSKEIEEKQQKYLSYFSNFQTNNCTEFIEYQQSLRNVFSLDLNNHFIQMMEHLDPYPKFNLEEIVPAFLVIWNKEKIYKKVQDPKKIKKRSKKNQKCYKRQFSSESEAQEFIQKIKNKNQYYQFQLREEECDSYIINYCYIKDQTLIEEFIGGKKGDIVKNTSQFQIQKQNEHYKYYEQLSKTFKCQNISKNQALSELNIDPEAIEQWVNEGIFITNSLLLTEKELTQEKLRKHLQFIDNFPTICNSNYSVSLHQLFLSFTLQDLDMDFLKANLELIYKQKPQALSKGSFWSSFPAASLEVSQQILQYQYNLCIEDGQQFLGQVFEFPKTATYFESFITIGQMPEASSNLIFVVDYLIEKIINQIYKIQDKSNQVMVDILVIEQFIELIVNYPLITPTILKYKLKQGFKNKYFDIPAGTSFFKFLIIITPLCYNINKLLFNAFYMVPYYYEKIENKKKFQRQFKIDEQNNSEIEDIGEDLDDINSDEEEEKFLSSKDILRNKIFSQLVYLVEEILEKKKTQEWTKKDIVFLKGYFNYLQPNLFDSIVHYKRIIRIYEKILEIYYHEPNKSKSNLLKKIDFLFPSNSFLKAIFDILLELKRSIFKSIPDTAGLGHQFLYYYYQKNLIQWTDELNEERKQKGLEQMIKEQREKDEKEIIEFSDEHKEIKNFRNEQLDFEMSKKAQKIKQQIINNNNNIFDKGQGYQGWKKGILFQIGMNNLCKKEELNVLFQTDMQENQELYNQVLDDFDFEFKEWEIEKNIDIFPEEYQKSLLRSKSDKLNKEGEMFKLPIQFKYLIDYQYKKYEKKLQIYQEKEKRAKNNFLMDQDLNDQFQQNILEEQKQYEVNNNHYSFSSSNYELSDSEESYNSLSKQISEQNSDFNQSENNLTVGKQSQYMKQRSFIMDTHFLEDQQSLSSQQIDQFQDEQILQKNNQIQQDLSKVLLMDRKLSKSEQIKVELIKFQEQKLLKNFVYLDENKCNINNWQQSGLDINQVEKNYCFNLLYSPHLTKEDFNYLIRKLDSNFLKQIDPSQIQPKELQQDQFSVPSDLSEDLSEIKNSPQVSDLEEEDYEPVLKLKDAVYESKSDYEKVYNREFFEQYPLFSDESIQALVLMACSNNLNYDVQRQLCMHPLNNYRIYDATGFLLSLRKEDYKILSENNEKDFGQFYDKEKTDKQHYIPQMTNLFFNKDNLFEKQKRKFGFPYIFRSIFTKTKNIRLLDEDFIMDREEKQENWRTLPILENARKILEQKENQNLNKKGSQKENLLNQQNNSQKINWQSFITIAQINLIEIYQSIECTPFFKDCAQLIKVSPEDNRNQQPQQTQYQQFMNQQQQFSGQKQQQQQFQQHQQLQQQQYLQQQQQQQFNLVEHFWKNIDCFQQEERKKKVQEKIYFPEVNYFKLFQNYPVIFQNFCQGSLVSIKSDIQKIIQQTIEFKPSLFRVAVKGFFSEVSETGNQVICDLIDKCVEYQEHFYKKYKSIQKEKNLEKQIDMKSYNDISSRYLVLFQSKELEYNLQNILKYSQNFWQLFTDVILKIVYKQCKINKKHKLVQQKFKRKEKERQENESLYQQLNGQLMNMAQSHAQPQNVQNSNNIKKLQKQIAKVEAKKAQNARDIQKLLNRFYKEKNQTKQKCQEIVRESVSNLQFLNLFFRNLVEAEYMLVDFLGPNLNIDPLADGIKSLITTGWSVNLQEDDYENLEEDEDEDIFQDNAYSFPKILSKDISNTGVQGLMSNQPINTNGLPISMVKKTFSNTKDIIITLPSTFAMLFGRIYPIVQNLRELPPQIESSIFKIAIQKASQHVQFNKKLRYLKSEADKKAHQLDANVQDKKHYNIIDRAMPWTSSVQNIFFKYTIPEIIVHDVRVKFDGEPGEDWGGLRNEWLAMLNNEVFNPNYGLFAMTSNKASIYPSPYAYLIPDYLTHFRMLGRLVGKSLISNWQLYVSFSKAFLKLILGKSLYISDLEDIDPEFSKNLEFILNTEIGDDLGLNFTTSFSQFGIQKFIQLEEDGSDKFVNDENKKEYVKARCKAFLTDSIHKQTIAFRQGLNDIIPQKALSCLNENELGLHLSGMPSLDIKELQKYCQLKGGFQKDDSTIRYFFEILESFDDVMKANLLFFFTGAFKVPIDGFKNNPLRLAKINIKDRLPVAHTCFNQIDLPDYDNKEILRERLMTAIFEGHSGFHIE